MSEKSKHSTKQTHVHVGGRMHRMTTVHDEHGGLLHRIVEPVMIEFYPRDVFQTVVGSILLAVPMAFTDEVWRIGAELSTPRIVVIGIVSVLAIATFFYYNIYKSERNESFDKMIKRGHAGEFVKRVVGTYLVALTSSFLILMLLDKAPIGEHLGLTLHRAVLVALPASMSASVADILK